MFTDAISHKKTDLSISKPRQILKEHFDVLYLLLSESRLVPHAAFEQVGEVKRGLSGIPVPYHNAVLGCPEEPKSDPCITEQLCYFKKENMPFVWYVEEEDSQEFKKKLMEKGFQDGGIFKGVICSLKKPFPHHELPSDCVVELVETEDAMDLFNELLSTTFGFDETSKPLYKKVLWDARKNPDHPMYHWMIRKQGQVISILSTLVQGNIVSSWNVASLPEVRRQGLSTALHRFALNDAISKGAHIGASYLMSEGMALGVYESLGYQTHWRFHVFLSP